MRWMSFFLPLLMLISVQVSALQQYSEGACILLDQQVQRFSSQPQSSNYRNAKSEYDKKCLRPTKAKPPVQQARGDNTVVTPQPQQAAPEVVSTAEPEQTQTETEQAEVIQPVAELASPVIVAEELLQAAPEPEPEPEQSADNTMAGVSDSASGGTATNNSEAGNAENEPSETFVPVPVIVPAPADSGDWWHYDNLIKQLLTNLPLVIANILAFLLAVFLLTNWLGLNLPGFKGIFAEYKLNRLLRWRLARGYRHFRKLKLLTAKEELVVVDHLVLSPFGIFVILVKGDRGNIYGEVAQANWQRQYFGSKKQFMNPLHQNFKNMEAIKHHLQLQGTDLAQHVHSVVAFSRVAHFKTEMPANVTYVDTTSVYLKKFEEPCFDDDQLNRFAALLHQASTAL
ncbi:nuclease-related domain-containing protein [Arsukibacterium sp. UBA3155]|uniref:nuclease-related domain-containing protein n=1 Tax=Arsukibacterium sp. UBA3155 TaxID=1946058 RepID=UPI0025BA8341|nr:nuclease-related domain-containing protein [Arsukibacterium sp. UBA3155]|tara:strand:+ start:219727 stop:220923 length:1197 start_codon:yes stop_codon:yes gene_type:complete